MAYKYRSIELTLPPERISAAKIYLTGLFALKPNHLPHLEFFSFPDTKPISPYMNRASRNFLIRFISEVNMMLPHFFIFYFLPFWQELFII